MANASLLLVVFLCVGLTLYANARPSVKLSSEVVNKICSKSINTSFCLNVLNSDPRTATSDLKGLGLITINDAQTNLTANLNLIKSLSSQATDPTLKKRYEDCSDHYDDGLSDIQDALQSLNSGDYQGANIQTSAVFTDVDDCEQAWADPPADPSQLPGKNKDLKDLLDIILVITNVL